MNVKNLKNFAPLCLVSVLVLVLDQITKAVAEANLVLNRPVRVVESFNLTLIYNKGAAFGMFSGLSDDLRRFILIIVSIIALIVVIYVILKEFNRTDRWAMNALALILGGAIGNIYDRVRFDYVIDFLDFYAGHYHWPAFNVADSAICIGVFILIVRSIQVRNKCNI